MKIQHIILESVDPEAVKSWMYKHGIGKYELHDDGSVTFGGAGLPEITLGDPRFPIPFNAIRSFNGSITIGCYSGTSSQFHKFLQRADYGSVTIKIFGAAPVLSFSKIKGSAKIHVRITGRKPDGTTGRLLALEDMLAQGFEDIKYGVLDVFEFQDQLIDAGYKEYAKL